MNSFLQHSSCNICFNCIQISLTAAKRKIQGYIGSVSPIKKSKRSGVQYFEFSVLTENKRERGVSFCQQHHKQLQDAANTKTPLSIENVPASGDILINSHTKMDTCSPLPFQPVADNVLTTPLSDIVHLKSHQVCAKYSNWTNFAPHLFKMNIFLFTISIHTNALIFPI